MAGPVAFPARPDVPIVGQAFEVFEFVPVVVMRCKCDDANRPMTLAGSIGQARCAACGTIYVVLGIQYDRMAGLSNVAIGMDRTQRGNGRGPQN
jgi:hypothetical protein